MNVCGKCGQLGAKSRCSRCKFTYYCNQDCQRKDWKLHKKICKAKPTLTKPKNLNKNDNVKDNKDDSKHDTQNIFQQNDLSMDSKIMTETEQTIFLKLMNGNGNNLGTQWNLLYRATEHGWSKKDLLNKAENVPKTIIVIDSVNIYQQHNVFGGYTSTPIKGNNKWAKDNKAFLFLIRSSKNYKPNIFDVFKSEKAIYHCSDALCNFYDILVYPNCNKNKLSSTRKYAYKVPSAHYLSGDVKNYWVKEIELFSCGM
eukprot:227079_1